MEKFYSLEYNGKTGHYRVCFKDKPITGWSSYTHAIAFSHEGGQFIAFSQYWDGTGDFDLPGVHQIARSFYTVKVSEPIKDGESLARLLEK